MKEIIESAKEYFPQNTAELINIDLGDFETRISGYSVDELRNLKKFLIASADHMAENIREIVMQNGNAKEYDIKNFVPMNGDTVERQGLLLKKIAKVSSLSKSKIN